MSFVVFFLLFLLCQMEMQKECGVAEHNMHAAPCGLRCWHHWALSKLSQLICRILTTAGKAITGAKHLHVLASLPNLALMNAFSLHCFRACCLCASHSCSCLLCDMSSLAEDACMLAEPVWREPPCTLHVWQEWPFYVCQTCDGKPCLPVELVTGIFVLPVACISEGKSTTICCKHFQKKVTQLPVVVSISDGTSCDFLLLQAFLIECPENLVFSFCKNCYIWGPQPFVKRDLHTERSCSHSVAYCRRSCWQPQAILHTRAWQWAGSHNMLVQ